MTLSKRNIIVFIIAVLLGLGIGSAGGFLTYDFLRTDVFDGVYLEDLSLGKLSRDAVLQELQDYLGVRLAEPVILKAPESTQSYTVSELGLVFEYEQMADAAMQIGRTGGWFAQRRARKRALKYGLTLRPILSLDESQLALTLQPFRRKVEQEPISARWEVLPDGYGVKLIPAQSGRKVDIDGVAGMLTTLLEQPPPYEIDVPFTIIDSRLDTEEAVNLGISEVIASYRTFFNSENTSRVKNIKLAAKAIDGKILVPGEIFSFNRLVGPRVPDSGYEEAPIIVEGKLVPGIGGGVCQVSSTLYNAAVLANLSVVERNQHTLLSAYVGPGRDATVFDNYLDLKLHNDTPRAVIIRAAVDTNYVDIKILSQWVDNFRIQIEVEELETIAPVWVEKYDPTLLPWQRIVEKEALAGQTVRVWKHYLGSAGEILTKEVLSVDSYQPINGVVRVGTRPQPTKN